MAGRSSTPAFRPLRPGLPAGEHTCSREAPPARNRPGQHDHLRACSTFFASRSTPIPNWPPNSSTALIGCLHRRSRLWQHPPRPTPTCPRPWIRDCFKNRKTGQCIHCPWRTVSAPPGSTLSTWQTGICPTKMQLSRSRQDITPLKYFETVPKTRVAQTIYCGLSLGMGWMVGQRWRLAEDH